MGVSTVFVDIVIHAQPWGMKKENLDWHRLDKGKPFI